jgi:phage virion morphogenesis protein
MLIFNTDDREIQGLLKRVLNKSSDMSPVTKMIGKIMLNAVRENFEQEGRPKWPPLSHTTIKERRKKGFWPGRILRRDDSLLSSIFSRNGLSSAEVGTDKPYARILHSGGKAGRGRKVTIPPRPFLTLTDEDVNEIKDVLKRFLDNL